MENNEKIVKVYSNNSKKARIKRRKNKFQRIWDAEKQTYIKIRKPKYEIKSKTPKKDWRDVDNSKALKRRQKTSKEVKNIPVNAQQMEAKLAKMQKPENKKQVRKEPTRTKSAKITKIHGINYTWDAKTLHYKRAA